MPLLVYKRSVPFLQKSGEWDGEGKGICMDVFFVCNWVIMTAVFIIVVKGLLIRQKMSDDVCVAGALINMGHLYRVAGSYDDALDYYDRVCNMQIHMTLMIRTTNWNNA